ncbi:Carbamoyltransferase [Prochlorococcus marinus str. MIT 9311]|nr:Carbamoyltransferase [Prochlorococcus marinus str. MIT 9311]
MGISCYYHDSAASLIGDGEILAAVQEERFTRKKHDSSFPENAIKYCLKSQNISINDLEYVIYYEKPLLTFERLLETYLATAPRGLRSFIAAMQVWLKEKLFLKTQIKKEVRKINSHLTNSRNNDVLPKLLFSEHHFSHAAAAFYPSPFEEAVILCMDGVGEWASTSCWIGKGNKIKPLWEISFPHSLGLLYSAFTYYCGFKVNSGEYKLMGLAPYGSPKYVEKIESKLIDIKEDGTFKLDLSYFKFHRGFRMTSSKFHKLFGAKPRKSEDEILQFHMDLAASIQKVTENIVTKLANTLRKETGQKNICLSGGVALNCVANGKLLDQKIFDDIWIQPASGDAGSSLGCSLLCWHQYMNKKRIVNPNDSMKGTYLGCQFSNSEILDYLTKIKANFLKLDDDALFKEIAKLLDEGKVIGWFNGPMEFGPRSLGARSIIGDPRNKEMQSVMNLKIKFRESFRPFAPSVLEEDISNIFEISKKSPYMLLVAPVKNELCNKMSKEEEQLFGIDKLNIARSSLPAITHVDYSARIQTVNENTNPRYYKMIREFKKLTECPSIVNTSFNVRGEPIVCTPQDAYRCFMRTEMDVLVLQNQILFKDKQAVIENDEDWKQEFELD